MFDDNSGESSDEDFGDDPWAGEDDWMVNWILGDADIHDDQGGVDIIENLLDDTIENAIEGGEKDEDVAELGDVGEVGRIRLRNRLDYSRGPKRQRLWDMNNAPWVIRYLNNP